MRKKRRRRRKTSRINVTRHRRVIFQPEVRRLALQLRRDWKKLDRIERGRRLGDLKGRGCSTRGLAEAIKQSATSIRRHIEISELPKEKQTLICRGASAKKILEDENRARRSKRQGARIREDKRSGKFSDELANVILRFCRTEKGYPESPMNKGDLPILCSEVQRHVTQMELRNQKRARTNMKMAWTDLLKATRPSQSSDAFWFEHRSEWLATILRSKEAETVIIQEALKKAKRRRDELDKIRTPVQTFDDSIVRRLMVSASPRRRRY